jgi:hypothetical protein
MVARGDVEKSLRGVVKKNARMLMETGKKLDLAAQVEEILNNLV